MKYLYTSVLFIALVIILSTSTLFNGILTVAQDTAIDTVIKVDQGQSPTTKTINGNGRFQYAKLPPDYQAIKRKVSHWSDVELRKQSKLLYQLLLMEKQWGMFFQGAVQNETSAKEMNDRLFNEYVDIYGASRLFAGDMALGLKKGGSRSMLESAYIHSAGWIDELTKRRRRFERDLLVQVLGAADGDWLDEIWNPKTEEVMDLPAADHKQNAANIVKDSN